MLGTVLHPEARCLWPTSVLYGASRTVEPSDTGLWAQAKHDLILVLPLLWANDFTSLSHSFLLCIMGMTFVPMPHRI